jgi:threonylcarbamoyladenosine tRNA methylthiotransferase MtaB
MSVDIVTFGCRLNTAESEVMRAQAEAAGHRDLIVVNTCAVTAEATRQARQTIRRLAREKPGVELVVTGCAAQIEPETFAAMPEVARVLGNHAKTKGETWRALRDPSLGTEKVRVDDIMAVRETALHLVGGAQGRARSFLQVQNGCDHRCTFCIIPYGRGNSRSVPMGAVVEQVRNLVEHGSREVCSRRRHHRLRPDLPGEPKLGALVKSLLRHVPELSAFASRPSIRGGGRRPARRHRGREPSDAPSSSLAPGGRRHGAQAHEAPAPAGRRDRLLRAGAPPSPDMVFGPTSSRLSHGNRGDVLPLLDIVEECGLTHLHVFPFSPRPGTPAARMPPVAREVVKERAARLRQKGEAALAAHLASEVGTRRRVLTETEGLGRTEGFALVRFPAPVQAGEILDATIAAQDGRELIAA